MYLDVKLEHLSDKLIRWELYTKEINLCSKFPSNEWSKIITDISSDKEWNQFLSDYKDIIECYILIDNFNNNIIGFIYIYLESYSCRVLSIHGGGWNTSTKLSILYYRGIFKMIDSILNQNIKLRTSCLKDNTKAFNYIKSLGFVKFREDEKFFYFWINRRRINLNKIYKRIKNQTKI